MLLLVYYWTIRNRLKSHTNFVIYHYPSIFFFCFLISVPSFCIGSFIFNLIFILRSYLLIITLDEKEPIPNRKMVHFLLYFIYLYKKDRACTNLWHLIYLINYFFSFSLNLFLISDVDNSTTHIVGKCFSFYFIYYYY